MAKGIKKVLKMNVAKNRVINKRNSLHLKSNQDNLEP